MNAPISFRFAAIVLCGLLARPGNAAELKAGFAERDISPDIGMEQPGSYSKVYHKGFHDPCKARVALFDDGKKIVVLVGLDALTISRDVVLKMRSDIQQRVGIPGDAVMIAATHSHSSGPTGMLQPSDFAEAGPEIRKLVDEDSSVANVGYLNRVIHEVTEGVKAAYGSRVPVTLGFGRGQEGSVSFNRRLRMKSGVTWSHPGAMNPDILEVAGPIDPEVGVIGAWDKAGQLVGVIVNFACHATTNPPGGISANWPGYMERTVQGALNTRAPIVFMQGACGDVTQVNSLSPYVGRDAEAMAQLVGGRVGAEVVKVLLGLPRTADVALASRQKIWQVKRRVPAPQSVAHSRQVLAQGKAHADTVLWTFAKETLLTDYLVTSKPAVEVETQAIQIGPAVYLSNPAEYFVQYGLNIKKRSPFPFTFPVELANGCVGYVPTEEAFSPTGGGYETRLTSYSNLEVSAGTQFEEAEVALAKDLTPGAVPEFPRLPAHGQPWRYGNVAPQIR